jgi:hypothetical protein
MDNRRTSLPLEHRLQLGAQLPGSGIARRSGVRPEAGIAVVGVLDALV